MYGINEERIGTSGFSFKVGNAKWYENKTDCIKFSKEYPHITIDVHGRGEESGDVWKARYRNGDFETVTLPENLPPFTRLI